MNAHSHETMTDYEYQETATRIESMIISNSMRQYKQGRRFRLRPNSVNAANYFYCKIIE